MSGSVYIHGYGVISPVGLNAAETFSSIRAGISRYEESAIMGRYEPHVLSVLPDDVLPPLNECLVNEPVSSRHKRMLMLAGRALLEVLCEFDDSSDLPVYLGLPETLYDRSPCSVERFLDDLTVQAGILFDAGAGAVFAEGRAGGFTALSHAVEAVMSGRFTYAVAGAVDSCLDPRLLADLDKDRRIKGSRVLDGFIPGEGAAFVLVGAVGAQAPSQKGHVEILSVNTGHEPGHLFSEEPCRGEVLADLFKEALGPTSALTRNVQAVCAGFNGEHFHTKEWGIAKMRNEAQFLDEYALDHPADCLGDVGAALGPVMIALAADELGLGRKEGAVLIWGSSDRGRRGVVILDSVKED